MTSRGCGCRENLTLLLLDGELPELQWGCCKDRAEVRSCFILMKTDRESIWEAGHKSMANQVSGTIQESLTHKTAIKMTAAISIAVKFPSLRYCLL